MAATLRTTPILINHRSFNSFSRVQYTRVLGWHDKICGQSVSFNFRFSRICVQNAVAFQSYTWKLVRCKLVAFFRDRTARSVDWRSSTCLRLSTNNKIETPNNYSFFCIGPALVFIMILSWVLSESRSSMHGTCAAKCAFSFFIFQWLIEYVWQYWDRLHTQWMGACMRLRSRFSVCFQFKHLFVECQFEKHLFCVPTLMFLDSQFFFVLAFKCILLRIRRMDYTSKPRKWKCFFLLLIALNHSEIVDVWAIREIDSYWSKVESLSIGWPNWDNHIITTKNNSKTQLDRPIDQQRWSKESYDMSELLIPNEPDNNESIAV